MLLQKIKDLLRAFDAELRLLRHEKTHLDVDLKNADLRYKLCIFLGCFEELILPDHFDEIRFMELNCLNIFTFNLVKCFCELIM